MFLKLFLNTAGSDQIPLSACVRIERSGLQNPFAYFSTNVRLRQPIGKKELLSVRLEDGLSTLRKLAIHLRRKGKSMDCIERVRTFNCCLKFKCTRKSKLF